MIEIKLQIRDDGQTTTMEGTYNLGAGNAHETRAGFILIEAIEKAWAEQVACGGTTLGIEKFGDHDQPFSEAQRQALINALPKKEGGAS